MLKFNWKGDLEPVNTARAAEIALVTAFGIVFALSRMILISLHAKDPFSLEINPDATILVLYVIFLIFTSQTTGFYLVLGISLLIFRFFTYLYLKSTYSHV